MITPTLTCKDEQRRHRVREKGLNGIDYVEVIDRHSLTVFFLGKAPPGLTADHIRITGGTPPSLLKVEDIALCTHEEEDRDDCLHVFLEEPGELITYRLCLVELDEETKRPTELPFPGFDPRYSCIDFSFRVVCPRDLDCKPSEACPPEELPEPEISYLAKDYASFRQLILDRLALVMPDWQERHVPDVGIALAEILAYTGDHLSYYQDAVATEAYLGTARQRISVRRHARLVDYQMHEGCNARAWVCIETDDQFPLHPEELFFITGEETTGNDEIMLTREELEETITPEYEVFEPLVSDSKQTIHLYPAHNQIDFHTWGNRQCCLPRGASGATLVDAWLTEVEPPEAKADDSSAQQAPVVEPEPVEESVDRARRLDHLKKGAILIFEEVKGARTGEAADADPTHRHAVCLTNVTPSVDPVLELPVVEIEWAEEDALPFPLCLSSLGPATSGCALIDKISVARGNVILVDHGQKQDSEELGEVALQETTASCERQDLPSDVSLLPKPIRPRLKYPDLTYAQPLSTPAPASRLMIQDPRLAIPQVKVTGARAAPGGDLVSEWLPLRDLLASGPEDRHLVVEIDDRRRAHIRFGDGELGKVPEVGTSLTAVYRVGNGPIGNVGAKSITRTVFRQSKPSGITLKACNPMPAFGGVAPEPLKQVKLLAPHTFRKELQRAISTDDYENLVLRHFPKRVQRAAASLRWTGSWYEVVVAIDAMGQAVADPELLQEIDTRLRRFRRMGHDLQVVPALLVPLDIAMEICVDSDYLRGHVKASLLDTFSNRRLADGSTGFFHPDNLSFGEGVRLSRLVAAARAVAGVINVTVTRLQRLWEGDNEELDNGILPLTPREVARLDNDPSFPENGRLELTLRGGR
jgi:hypothetical protein